MCFAALMQGHGPLFSRPCRPPWPLGYTFVSCCPDLHDARVAGPDDVAVLELPRMLAHIAPSSIPVATQGMGQSDASVE